MNLRNILVFGLALVLSSVGLAGSEAVSVRTGISKPAAPTIRSISSSAAKKGKVSLKITLELPTSNGGSKFTGSKISVSGKSCKMAKSRTSCTVKNIKVGKTVTVKARTKNRKGFGAWSSAVRYTAGSAIYTRVVPWVPSYALGDVGPGGGIVFFVSAAGFDEVGATCSPTCHYLEAYPYRDSLGNINHALDPVTWSGNTNTLTSQPTGDPLASFAKPDGNPLFRNADLGQGLSNTRIIASQSAAGNISNNASIRTLAFGGTDNSVGQWFVPSLTELNELCKYATEQAPGTISTSCVTTGWETLPAFYTGTSYWWVSSTEFDADEYWCSHADGEGVPGIMSKSDVNAGIAFPIRAF